MEEEMEEEKEEREGKKQGANEKEAEDKIDLVGGDEQFYDVVTKAIEQLPNSIHTTPNQRSKMNDHHAMMQFPLNYSPLNQSFSLIHSFTPLSPLTPQSSVPASPQLLSLSSPLSPIVPAHEHGHGHTRTHRLTRPLAMSHSDQTTDVPIYVNANREPGKYKPKDDHDKDRIIRPSFQSSRAIQ